MAVLLLQLLIILSLSYMQLQKAQIIYSPTAKLPLSWTNFLTTTGYDHIILSNEKPNAGYGIGFGCGFYSQDDGKLSFYLAIGTAEASIGFDSGKQVWSFKNITWVANRNRPVGKNATLQFLADGNLILKDADGSFVWSTNTPNKSVVGMKMMESGNLVLHNADNKTVWQSFDYPTDTLLPGQKLMAGKKLVASVSETNMSEGNYYFTVTSEGLSGFYQADVPLRYFNYSSPGDATSIELKYNDDASGSASLYFLLSYEYPIYFMGSPINMTDPYMRLDPDGHLRFYSDNSPPFDLLLMDECEYPTSCGNFGLCKDERCSCPAGFAENNATDGQGEFKCSQINPNTCKNPSSQFLISYENTYYFSYDHPVLRVTDMESCKVACLKNCSCEVALFRYYDNFSLGECIMPSPVLSLIGQRSRIYNQFYIDYDYQSYAFIKISNDGPSSRGSDASLNASEPGRRAPKADIRSDIIAGSTVGAFLLVGLIFSLFWIVCPRKKRDGEEGMEEYCLDQLSGMPMRFTYEELKVATQDFGKKLGGGGFGSVFEGNKATGEKIAVKRQDALGQGKKEFLAEVKTIGSIHHNNLVRLIGFCAEKLHRLLVYEFMCNGSLDKWIFHKDPLRTPLDWRIRRTIILDIAKGLAYLHEDCRQRIVHLDIKPQNILLDADLHAKISDFGLSKLIDRDQSQVVTTMRGTPGYLAPEWFNSVITEKTDVYSFGIVVTEVVCGRKNLDRSQPDGHMHLLPIVMRKAEEGQLIDMVDKSSEDMEMHGLEAVEMMKVAIWCLQSDYKRRPSMSMVVKVLEGSMDVETELDYSLQNATTIATIRSEAELGTTATLLPSVLSWPR